MLVFFSELPVPGPRKRLVRLVVVDMVVRRVVVSLAGRIRGSCAARVTPRGLIRSFLVTAVCLLPATVATTLDVIARSHVECALD